MDGNGCRPVPEAQRREIHLSVLHVWWSTQHSTWPSPGGDRREGSGESRQRRPSPKESHIAPNAMSMSVVFLLLVHSCSPSPSNLSHLQNSFIQPIYANQIQRQLSQTHVSHYSCFRDLVRLRIADCNHSCTFSVGTAESHVLCIRHQLEVTRDSTTPLL